MRVGVKPALFFVFMAKQPPKDLTEKQRAFCRHYILNWNGTQAAIKAGYSENTAGAIASENLQKPEIQDYIKDIQLDLEKVAGISRLRIIQEAEKIAFSSIASLHNTWIALKDFEGLSEEQKASIASIETQKRVEIKYIGDTEVPWEVDYVKIKLHDKIRGMELINKILGYNAPEKMEHSGDLIRQFAIKKASGKGALGQ